VSQVLAWLALPEEQRPAFVTLYFSEVDHAGHDFGPDSWETMDAAAHLDVALGELLTGVDRLGLLARTTFVVVSDHGMSGLSDDRVIFLDDYLDLSTVDVVEWTPNLTLVPRSVPARQVYESLRGRHPALSVFERAQVPADLHYRDNARIAPIVALADDGWTITSHERFAADRAAGRVERGAHGYDPATPSMSALFVAAGPRLRSGVVVPGLENIHVYEFLCELLSLKPAPNDGRPGATRQLFRD
jgi:predicted AlkP superfamily pyrophosphatase or phosphodiesterase